MYAGDLNLHCGTLKQALEPIEPAFQTRIRVSLLLVTCQSNIYADVFPDGPGPMAQWKAVTPKRRISVEFYREKSMSTDLRSPLYRQCPFLSPMVTWCLSKVPIRNPLHPLSGCILLISKQLSLPPASLNLDSCSFSCSVCQLHWPSVSIPTDMALFWCEQYFSQGVYSCLFGVSFLWEVLPLSVHCNLPSSSSSEQMSSEENSLTQYSSFSELLVSADCGNIKRAY